MAVVNIARKGDGNGDPLRAALAAAVAKAAATEDAVEKHSAAIDRARNMVRDAETRLEAATAAVAAAREEDAQALVASISTGGEPSARAIKRARAAEVEAADDVEVARGALAALKEELSGVMADRERATKAIDLAIAGVLLPLAKDLFAEALRARARYQTLLFSLGMLREPLGIMSEMATKIEGLTHIGRFAAEDRELSLAVRAEWQPALEKLKLDAGVELPG